MRASQPKLQIEDKRIRGNPLTALQEARKILDGSSARTPDDDHFMADEITQQPPIALETYAQLDALQPIG